MIRRRDACLTLQVARRWAASSSRSVMMRWSQNLPTKVADICASHRGPRTPARVALEGCRTAFNATNSIRVSLFFATFSPVTFLGISSLDDIASLVRRESDASESKQIAHFSPSVTAMPPLGESRVGGCHAAHANVAIECFVDGAIPIDAFRFFDNEECGAPSSLTLVMGDENKGVRRESLASCGAAIFIPQFGTISSINVVTSMGIALFHAWMDARAGSGLRRPRQQVLSSVGHQPLPSLVSEYLDAYSRPLPVVRASTESVNAGERIDPRPVHPVFYGLEKPAIVARHQELLRQLFSAVARPFRVSLMFENDLDLRNLGGLIRNANAFCSPMVLYCGSRHINRKGAVGSDHYTELRHLGRIRGPDGKTLDADLVNDVCSSLRRLLSERNWQLWFLSCHHEHLLSDSVRCCFEAWAASVPVTSLDDDEEVIAAAVRASKCDGVVLLVPQEGMVPLPQLLEMCSRRLVVTSAATSGSWHCGLPSQVASGIALQRLFTITNRLALLCES